MWAALERRIHHDQPSFLIDADRWGWAEYGCGDTLVVASPAACMPTYCLMLAVDAQAEANH
ncbi:hypothetical protein D9M68_463730 [compost metagenome]